MRGNAWLPLVLLITAGQAALESPARRGSRLLASVMVLGLSLIDLNTIGLVTLRQTPRLSPEVAAPGADRSRVRRSLQEFSADERAFSAPQDVALQHQLDEPSVTAGSCLAPRGCSSPRRHRSRPPGVASRSREQASFESVSGLPTDPLHLLHRGRLCRRADHGRDR